MSSSSTPAVVPLALTAGTVLLLVAACGGAQEPAAGPTVTVTASPAGPAGSPSASGTPSSTSGLPASSSPRPGSGTDGGTCAVSALRVRYADAPGGAGAGSVTGTLTFTNTSASTCSLRGFPGVSYVTGSQGTQVGQPASRTDDEVATQELAAGGKIEAALRRTQARNYGDTCDATEVAGFRVYPPGSTEAVFVAYPTTGCRSTSAALLQVGPVR